VDLERATHDRQAATGAVATDRTGVLIIRAWIEEGSSEPLHAQVRLSTDVSTGLERSLTLARPEAVCAMVREWLATISSDSERATETSA
jgi:hypothetical protein